MLFAVCLLGAASAAAVLVPATVAAWGDNRFGQTDVPARPTNLVAVSAGYFRSLAVKADGTAMAWGSTIPGDINVATGLTTVAAVAVGGQHSLALRSNSTVVAWGDNSLGQTNVPAGLTNVVAIAAGTNHSLALSNHSVVAWGQYDNDATNVPLTVPAGLTNVIAIACGDSHCLALGSNSLVVAWGNNSSGQTNVPDGLTNVVAVAAGGSHSLALKSDGTVVAWGNNASGQTNVPPGLTNVVAVAAGGGHSLALKSNGTVVAWGANSFGQASVPAALTNVVAVAAGYYHSLALTLRLTNSPVVLVDSVDRGGGSVERTNTTLITMSSTFGAGAHLYYTLDGSVPDFTGSAYLGAFTLTNSASIRAIAYNTNYTDWAEAAPIMVIVWPIYPLTVTPAGGGSVSNSPAPYSGNNLYVSNTLVTLTAAANAGWSFIGWTGDSTATTNVTTVVMTKAQGIQAVFGTPLSLVTNGNGQVLLDPTNGLYAYGSTVQVTALPRPGSRFLGWANAASGFANPLSFTFTNPKPGITALFAALKANQVALTVLSNGAGMVAVSPSQGVYTNGDTVTLAALPASNHVFIGWADDASGTANPLVLTLNTSKIITANFAPGTWSPPAIVIEQPLSRTLSPGAGTTLSSQVTGDGPFSYQWRFNSSTIAGARNPTLVLTNVTPTQAGLYDVVVTGAMGTVTSAPSAIALFGLEMALSDTDLLPLLSLDRAPGTRYQIEFLTNLPSTNWNWLVSVTNLDTRFYYVDEPVTNHSPRFYRAIQR